MIQLVNKKLIYILSTLFLVLILPFFFVHPISAQLYIPLPGAEGPIVPLIPFGPIRRPPAAPALNMSVTYIPNSDGATYTVGATWNNISNAVYSLALHNSPGGDPGPNVDTSKNYWYFYNVLPGTYYIDIKVGQNGYWSSVSPWTVNVPAWQPPVTPTPYSSWTDNSSSGTNFGAYLFLGSVICVIVSLILYIESKKIKKVSRDSIR